MLTTNDETIARERKLLDVKKRNALGFSDFPLITFPVIDQRAKAKPAIERAQKRLELDRKEYVRSKLAGRLFEGTATIISSTRGDDGAYLVSAIQHFASQANPAVAATDIEGVSDIEGVRPHRCEWVADSDTRINSTVTISGRIVDVTQANGIAAIKLEKVVISKP